MSATTIKRTQRPRDSKAREKQRFYLLPGQGGSNYRRKQRFIFKSSLAVGVIVSFTLAVAMYLICRPPR
jgi:hypothetical protein